MNASANPTHQTPLTADHSGPRTASSDATPVLPAAALGDGLAHVDLVWKQAALAYAVELGRRSGSVRTPQERMRYVARFLTAVPDPSRARPGEIHAFAYGIGPSGRPPSASTVTARLGAIRGFFAFAIRMGLLRDNPALAVKLPRPDAPIPRGLSAPQLRRLLEAVPATPSGARDRAIILTATLTGLRRSEVLGLQAGDLRADAAAGVVTFRVRAKGGKQRHRDLPPPALAAIRAALAARGLSLETVPAALCDQLARVLRQPEALRDQGRPWSGHPPRAPPLGRQAAPRDRRLDRGDRRLARPPEPLHHRPLPGPARRRTGRGLARSGRLAGRLTT
jgi:integrase